MLGKNFDELIDENRLTSVGLMYDLFLRIGPNAIQDLREAFGNYIKVTNFAEHRFQTKILFD